jgi:short-subunit dehydrogenase
MAKALILGGTSDIGIELAHEYARHGIDVVLGGRNLDKLNEIRCDIEIRYQSKVECVLFDALDYGSHAKVIQSNKDLTDAVCIFGYLGDQSRAENSFEEAERIIDINYKGAVSILNLVAESFKKNNGKIIIGVSSVAGDRGRQSNYIYGSAKAAFTIYLQGLRNSLYKSKIRVITIKPGYVKTKMTHGLALPSMLTVSARECAAQIFKARSKSSDVVYISRKWWFIMKIIKLVPERLFKRLPL